MAYVRSMIPRSIAVGHKAARGQLRSLSADGDPETTWHPIAADENQIVVNLCYTLNKKFQVILPSDRGAKWVIFKSSFSTTSDPDFLSLTQGLLLMMGQLDNANIGGLKMPEEVRSGAVFAQLQGSGSPAIYYSLQYETDNGENLLKEYFLVCAPGTSIVDKNFPKGFSWTTLLLAGKSIPNSIRFLAGVRPGCTVGSKRTDNLSAYLSHLFSEFTWKTRLSRRSTTNANNSPDLLLFETSTDHEKDDHNSSLFCTVEALRGIPAPDCATSSELDLPKDVMDLFPPSPSYELSCFDMRAGDESWELYVLSKGPLTDSDKSEIIAQHSETGEFTATIFAANATPSFQERMLAGFTPDRSDCAKQGPLSQQPPGSKPVDQPGGKGTPGKQTGMTQSQVEKQVDAERTRAMWVVAGVSLAAVAGIWWVYRDSKKNS